MTITAPTTMATPCCCHCLVFLPTKPSRASTPSLLRSMLLKCTGILSSSNDLVLLFDGPHRNLRGKSPFGFSCYEWIRKRLSWGFHFSVFNFLSQRHPIRCRFPLLRHHEVWVCTFSLSFSFSEFSLWWCLVLLSFHHFIEITTII